MHAFVISVWKVD